MTVYGALWGRGAGVTSGDGFETPDQDWWACVFYVWGEITARY